MEVIMTKFERILNIIDLLKESPGLTFGDIDIRLGHLPNINGVLNFELPYGNITNKEFRQAKTFMLTNRILDEWK